LEYKNLYNFCDALLSAEFDDRDLSYLKINNIKEAVKDCENFKKIDTFDVNLNSENNIIDRVAMSNYMRNTFNFFDSLIDLENQNLINEIDIPKYTMYSGHDSNVGSFLSFIKNALKLDIELKYIPFASSIIIEFLKNDYSPSIAIDSDYRVVIYYNEHKIYNKTFSQFKNYIKPVLVEQRQITDFCGFEENSNYYYILGIAILGGVSFFLGLWILLLISKNTDNEELPK